MDLHYSTIFSIGTHIIFISNLIDVTSNNALALFACHNDESFFCVLKNVNKEEASHVIPLPVFFLVARDVKHGTSNQY